MVDGQEINNLKAECLTQHIGLGLLSLALLISLCLNAIFCIKRRDTLCRDRNDCCSSHNFEEEGLTQEGHYFHDLNHHEQEENPHNYHEQQENPIYGNISIERRVSTDLCYEMMAKQQPRDRLKPTEPDLNYASLDLKMAKKRKKHRHQQGQPQGRNICQDQLPVNQNDFLEIEGDMDAHLPSRDTSTMVSHSSIYLNSQQIVQEAEERERNTNMENGWEGTRRREDVGSRKWNREEESEDRKDRQSDGNRIVCTEVNDIQSDTELLDSSFNHDSDQQH